jgi:hypothetical protein
VGRPRLRWLEDVGAEREVTGTELTSVFEGGRGSQPPEDGVTPRISFSSSVCVLLA